MQETRQNRIARMLQKELAEIFQSQTRMMRGVMVSVTRTKISPDLSICTAYLRKPRSCLPTYSAMRSRCATSWGGAYATRCA